MSRERVTITINQRQNPKYTNPYKISVRKMEKSMSKLRRLALEKAHANLKECRTPVYRIAAHDRATDELLMENPAQFRDTVLKEISEKVHDLQLEAENWIDAVLEDMK